MSSTTVDHAGLERETERHGETEIHRGRERRGTQQKIA